jgi:peptide/nickel transport system substrate-binding protein
MGFRISGPRGDTRPSRSRARRLALATTMVALAAAVAACTSGSGSHAGITSGTSATGAPQNGGTVTTAWPAGTAPDFIFPYVPAANSDGYNANLSDLLWPNLTYVGDGAQGVVNPKDSLWSSITYGNDDKTITIVLKPWKWSDGTPISSRDLVFSYNLIKANVPNWNEYLPGLFPDNVSSVTATSASTAVIQLTKSFNPSFYTDDVLSLIPLLPQHAWDKTSATGKVGNYDETTAGAKAVYAFLQKEGGTMATFTTNPLWKVVDGPFELSAFTPSSGYYAYKPNPEYSGPKVYPSEIQNLQFTTNAATMDAVRAGNGPDIAPLALSDLGQVPQLEAEGYSVASAPIPGVAGAALNFWDTTDSAVSAVFNQLYVRQAMEDLINRPQIVSKVFGGYADPGNGPVPVAGFGSWLSPLEKSGGPYPYNPSAAVRLLTAHGWKVVPNGTTSCEHPGTSPSECGAGIPAGQKLSFQYLYSSGDASTDAMEAAIQSSEEQAGITFNLKGEPFSTLASQVATCNQASHPASGCSWQIADEGYLPYSGPYPTGSGFFNTDGADNQGGYSNPEMDQLVNATEYGSSTATFYQYENFTAEQLPQLWVPQPDNIEVYKKNIGGLAPMNPFTGGINEQDWYLVK